mgnify:CR=1 FL=1
MSELKKLASRLMTLDDKLIFCMKCGNCQAVCPMFGATHMEADVARGKLALIGNLAHEACSVVPARPTAPPACASWISSWRPESWCTPISG